VNSVSLVGQLTGDPELSHNRAGVPECRMRIAVQRRSRNGTREPGAVYVDVTTFGEEARECKRRLKLGSRIGLSGRLAVDAERSEEGAWEESHGVLIDQLDFL
jgi:single-stranded DNA-binding protein